eukprot:Skav230389  [mRNA]  locus=scaffold62:398233:400787:- [translate_table: standard]
MVMGHTQCGAIVGATGTYLANQGKAQMKPGSALEGLLTDLSGVIKKASDEMGPGASKEKLAAHAVKVNVFETMNFLLQYSEPLRELISSGKVEGGIYHLETGRVEFLGRSPKHQELLAASSSLPPSMQSNGACRANTAGQTNGAQGCTSVDEGRQRQILPWKAHGGEVRQ